MGLKFGHLGQIVMFISGPVLENQGVLEYGFHYTGSSYPVVLP